MGRRTELCCKANDIGDAHPEIKKAVETMVTKGKWTVPGTFNIIFRKSVAWL